MRDETGPAFPSFQPFDRFDEARGEYVPELLPVGGISVRDYLAAKAMQGELASQSPENNYYGDEHTVAKRSYLIADAMLAERNKEQS